jgi:enoyl-CoA hydratase
VNECLPAFYNLARPVVGAVNGHALGVGLILASFCDVRAGGFNYLLPKSEVLPKAMQLARGFAKKSPPGLKANKICCNAADTMEWLNVCKFAQRHSSGSLTDMMDTKDGIRAFLERREPRCHDR